MRITEHNRKWWTLGAVSFALFMAMLDNTSVNVALPSIGRGLGISVSQFEWVVNGYTLSLVYALIEANNYGWTSARILGLFFVATALPAGFVLIEWRSARPMLDLTLFRNRTFSGANLAALLVSLAMFGIFFFVSLYMQNILGYSPVHAGVVFLPMTALVVISAPLAGKLTDLIGPRWPIAAGMTMLAVGLLAFSRLDARAGFIDLLPGMVIGGIGMGIAMGPMTTAALSAVSVGEAGVASGVLTTSRQVGGALGIAVMGAIVAAAETVAPTDPRFPLQFVDGFQHALEAGAVIALVGALLSAVLIRRQHEPAGRIRVEAADQTAGRWDPPGAGQRASWGPQRRRDGVTLR